MPIKRYRVIVKVLCPSCAQAKRDGTIVKDCGLCQFVKYRNVTRLVKFTSFIDKHFPDWVWFRVYEYIKGQDSGRELACYKNWYKCYIQDGKRWIYTGTERNVPTTEQI